MEYGIREQMRIKSNDFRGNGFYYLIKWGNDSVFQAISSSFFGNNWLT